MARTFSETMRELRGARGVSQRTAAAELGISQAQLSHYENGAREPGLAFLCRACDYYGVSADYLLGRTSCAVSGEAVLAEFRKELARLTARADGLFKGADQ